MVFFIERSWLRVDSLDGWPVRANVCIEKVCGDGSSPSDTCGIRAPR